MLSLRLAAGLAAAAAVAALALPSAGAAYSGNACGLLTKKQVAALGIGTSCTQKSSKSNPYYKGVAARWGKLGPSGASITLVVNKVANTSYLKVFEAQAAPGPSAGIGSWSRVAYSTSGRYCIVGFVTGSYVVELQVVVSASHKLPSRKPVVALAKKVAAELS